MKTKRIRPLVLATGDKQFNYIHRHNKLWYKNHNLFYRNLYDYCWDHGKDNFQAEIQTLSSFKKQQIGQNHYNVFSEHKNGAEGRGRVEGNGNHQALFLLIITSENGFDQFQMSARGDRQKLCKALDDSKNQRFKRTHLLFFLGINMA